MCAELPNTSEKNRHCSAATARRVLTPPFFWRAMRMSTRSMSERFTSSPQAYAHTPSSRPVVAFRSTMSSSSTGRSSHISRSSASKRATAGAATRLGVVAGPRCRSAPVASSRSTTSQRRRAPWRRHTLAYSSWNAGRSSDLTCAIFAPGANCSILCVKMQTALQSL